MNLSLIIVIVAMSLNFKLDENGKRFSNRVKKNHWEKVKLLGMSIFFFSHSVLKDLQFRHLKTEGLFGKG